MPIHVGATAAAIAAATSLAISCGIAVAGPIESTASRNKPAVLYPVMAYGADDCGSYPVTNLKVTAQPRHGTVFFVKGSYTLGKETGVCRGSKVNAQWLVYQPARNYSGPDSVSVAWNKSYENDITPVYVSLDFAIAVK